MAATKTHPRAKASVSQNGHRALPFIGVTIAAYGYHRSVQLIKSHFVRMAQIWLTSSAKASVTSSTLHMRIPIDGLVLMAPRSVSWPYFAVTGILIVTLKQNQDDPAMSRVARF